MFGVRPLNDFAISVHDVPNRATFSANKSSSADVHGPVDRSGSSAFSQCPLQTCGERFESFEDIYSNFSL